MNLNWRQVFPAFLIGCLLGACIGVWHQRAAFHRFWREGPNTQRLLDKFGRELKLDARQREDVKAVLERKREKTKALRQEMSSKFKEIRLSMRGDIEKLLSPEQKERFQRMQARWEARRKSRWGEGP